MEIELWERLGLLVLERFCGVEGGREALVLFDLFKEVCLIGFLLGIGEFNRDSSLFGDMMVLAGVVGAGSGGYCSVKRGLRRAGGEEIFLIFHATLSIRRLPLALLHVRVNIVFNSYNFRILFCELFPYIHANIH